MRSSVRYAGYELLRTFRNRRLAILSIAFPVLLYYAIAIPNRHEHDIGGTGIAATVYFMVGLAAFGTMNAVLGVGARIAADRAVGWNRHLRVTPLPTRTYVAVKLLTAYVMAMAAVAALYVAALTLGVRPDGDAWLAMTCLILVGLAPFAALGIVLGHVLAADSVGPAIGGTTALLALVSGVWFPVTSGAMHVIAQALPSYWLVRAGRVGLHLHGWGVTGWVVVGVWTAVGVVLARVAYARDTQRA
jgi:ABC-2 type transport system permease protein